MARSGKVFERYDEIVYLQNRIIFMMIYNYIHIYISIVKHHGFFPYTLLYKHHIYIYIYIEQIKIPQNRIFRDFHDIPMVFP